MHGNGVARERTQIYLKKKGQKRNPSHTTEGKYRELNAVGQPMREGRRVKHDSTGKPDDMYNQVQVGSRYFRLIYFA